MQLIIDESSVDAAIARTWRLAAGWPEALCAALNKIARGGLTDIARATREEYAIPAKRIREKIWYVRASPESLQIWYRPTKAGFKRESLLYLGARPKRPRAKAQPRPPHGIQVYVKRSEGKKYLPTSFIGTMKDSGGFAVFKRTGGVTKNKKASGVHKDELEKQTTSSVSIMTSTISVRLKTEGPLRERLHKRLEYETARMQKRWSR